MTVTDRSVSRSFFDEHAGRGEPYSRPRCMRKPALAGLTSYKIPIKPGGFA